MLFDPKWEEKVKAKPKLWQRILLDAADYIEEHGWVQGKELALDGSVCMIGAIAVVAAPTRFDRNVAREKLTRYIGGQWLAYWNDAPGRTQAQVLHALRGAAAGE